MLLSSPCAAVNAENTLSLIGLAKRRNHKFRRFHDHAKLALDRLHRIIEDHHYRPDRSYGQIHTALIVALTGWAETIADLTVANDLLNEQLCESRERAADLDFSTDLSEP